MMRLFWLLRKCLKRALCLCGMFTITEFCDRCGARQPLVWYTDDESWFTTTGQEEGVLCPRCFDERARKMGILLRWWAYREGDCPDQTTEAAKEET